MKPKWSDYKSSSSSVLTSRKSSSTPSLPEATENPAKSSVASMEQAASTDNLAAKQVAEAIAEGVLSLARAEAISAVSGESQNASAASNDSSLFVHHYGSSDLATIVETLTLDTQPPASGSTGNEAQSSTRHPETSSSKGTVASSGFLNKSFGQSRTNKMAIPASDVHSMLAAEAIEVLDKMREGQDLLRNNTNSFLSGRIEVAYKFWFFLQLFVRFDECYIGAISTN